MPRVAVFVSHSSKDADLTDALCAHLLAPDDQGEQVCDVLVDKTHLLAGTEWPKQLHEFMAKCHAAVILLTENAVTSDWVLKEATILAWRASIDQDFRVFLIQFPGVTADMLEGLRFKPLLLDSIQRVKLNEQSTGGGPDLEFAARQIRDLIAGRRVNDTAFDRLVGGLADLFAKVGDHTLLHVAEKMRLEPSAWKPDRERRGQCVEEIAGHIICENLGHYAGIHELIDDLSATTPLETLKQILTLVAPSWVDVGAAGRLPLLASMPQRAAVINGSSVGEFTAEMYVRRAHPLSNRHRVIQAAGGFAGDPAAHYTKEICALVRKRENRTDADEAIIEYVNKRRQNLYVLLPPPLPPSDALRTLLDRFPRLSFILWSGDQLEHDVNRGDVDWLMPEVDLEQEERELDSYRDAREIIRNIEVDGLGAP